MKFSNLSMRVKLFVGFGLILLLAILVGLFGYNGLQKIQTQETIASEITNVEANFLYARLSTLTFMSLQQDSWADEAKSAITATETSNAHLLSILDSQERLANINKLKSSIEDYRQGLNNIISSVKEQQALQANICW